MRFDDGVRKDKPCRHSRGVTVRTPESGTRDPDCGREGTKRIVDRFSSSPRLTVFLAGPKLTSCRPESNFLVNPFTSDTSSSPLSSESIAPCPKVITLEAVPSSDAAVPSGAWSLPMPPHRRRKPSSSPP